MITDRILFQESEKSVLVSPPLVGVELVVVCVQFESAPLLLFDLRGQPYASISLKAILDQYHRVLFTGLPTGSFPKLFTLFSVALTSGAHGGRADTLILLP